jgi:hypothetical protein
MALHLEFQDTFSTWRDKINDSIDQVNTIETTLNESAFSYKSSLTSGRTVKFFGGKVRDGSVVETLADPTITLPASSTCYVVINKETGVTPTMSAYTEANLPVKNVIPIAKFTTSASAVTSFSDLRTQYNTASGTTSSSSGVLQFDKLIAKDVTVGTLQNALSISPVVDSGVTVTVSTDSIWVVV